MDRGNKDTSSPTDTDRNVLNLLFGDRNCVDDPVNKFIWYLGLALLATLAFWILSTSTVNGYFSGTNGLYLRTAIFFVIILLLDYFFTAWRQVRPICDV